MWECSRLKTTRGIPGHAIIPNLFPINSRWFRVRKRIPSAKRETANLLHRYYLLYICIYFDTSTYDAQNSLAVPTALMLSRVMSDLAPTDAYFLLRCLNIILTMFLWAIEQTRTRLREKSKILRASGNHLSASIRFSCVLTEDSRDMYRLFCARFCVLCAYVVCDQFFDILVAFNFKGTTLLLSEIET